MPLRHSPGCMDYEVSESDVRTSAYYVLCATLRRYKDIEAARQCIDGVFGHAVGHLYAAEVVDPVCSRFGGVDGDIVYGGELAYAYVADVCNCKSVSVVVEEGDFCDAVFEARDIVIYAAILVGGDVFDFDDVGVIGVYSQI